MLETRPKGWNVLIFDDDKLVAQSIADDFIDFHCRMAHTITIVTDAGEMGRILAEERRFDEAVIDKGAWYEVFRQDRSIGHRGGLGVARTLRERDATCRIFLVSGESYIGRPLPLEVVQSGVNHFFEKPMFGKAQVFAELVDRGPLNINEMGIAGKF